MLGVQLAACNNFGSRDIIHLMVCTIVGVHPCPLHIPHFFAWLSPLPPPTACPPPPLFCVELQIPGTFVTPRVLHQHAFSCSLLVFVCMVSTPVSGSITKGHKGVLILFESCCLKCLNYPVWFQLVCQNTLNGSASRKIGWFSVYKSLCNPLPTHERMMSHQCECLNELGRS